MLSLTGIQQSTITIVHMMVHDNTTTYTEPTANASELPYQNIDFHMITIEVVVELCQAT